LLCFLFREAEALAIHLAPDYHLCRELPPAAPFGLADFKLDLFAGALRPFYDFAFMIGFRIDYHFQVKIGLNQFINDKFLATQITFIKVNRPYQGFQCIA